MKFVKLLGYTKMILIFNREYVFNVTRRQNFLSLSKHKVHFTYRADYSCNWNIYNVIIT